MNYQTLAIDLDGTLLVGEDLPADNADALRAAKAAGLQIIIATARWVQMAFRIADEIGLSEPVIACSGAQVHDRQRHRDIFDERLPADFTDDLFEICNAERCIATVTVGDSVLLKLDGKPDAGLMGAEMQWVSNLTADVNNLPRIAAIQGTRANARIRAELGQRYRDRVNIFDSIGPTGKIIITVTHKRATKGAALRSACEHLNLDPRCVVAFGDAENDLAMFNVAGASVAMGQASTEVKAAATIVTGTNHESGVAQVVNRLLASGQLGS